LKGGELGNVEGRMKKGGEGEFGNEVKGKVEGIR